MLPRTLRSTAFALIVLAPISTVAAPIQATLYKNPLCDRCDSYAKYLENNGFTVKGDSLPIKGIAIAGMPAGMPLMPGMQAEPINVYLVGTSKPVVFATVN